MMMMMMIIIIIIIPRYSKAYFAAGPVITIMFQQNVRVKQTLINKLVWALEEAI
jgi:hypothetical protein